MEEKVVMTACIPVIQSADIEKSLRFWVEGLGMRVDREMRRDEKLIGCRVHNQYTYSGLMRAKEI